MSFGGHGERPSADHSIDRKDGDGNYSYGHENVCEWMASIGITVGLLRRSKGETRKMLGFRSVVLGVFEGHGGKYGLTKSPSQSFSWQDLGLVMRCQLQFDSGRGDEVPVTESERRADRSAGK